MEAFESHSGSDCCFRAPRKRLQRTVEHVAAYSPCLILVTLSVPVAVSIFDIKQPSVSLRTSVGDRGTHTMSRLPFTWTRA